MPNNIFTQYQRHIWNPVEFLWWSVFTKIFNDWRSLTNFTKKLHLRLGSKYTLSIELILDRFRQSNKLRTKSKEKFRDIQQMIPNRSSDVFSRSSSGYHLKTSPGRQMGTSSGWSNRIFRGLPGDLGGGQPQDVLGTNIYWLGGIFKTLFSFLIFNFCCSYLLLLHMLCLSFL